MTRNARNPLATHTAIRRRAGTTRAVVGFALVMGAVYGTTHSDAVTDPAPASVDTTTDPAPAPAPVAWWPTPGMRVEEDSPFFDCRIDGDRHCGPGAAVPVPDPVHGMVYVSIFDAPWPPVWRGVTE